MEAAGPPPQINYHLELTPPQLKVTHTALHALLDGFGHDEADVSRIVHEVLAKLPDEHAIRAIDIPRESRREERGGEGPGEPPSAA